MTWPSSGRRFLSAPPEVAVPPTADGPCRRVRHVRSDSGRSAAEAGDRASEQLVGPGYGRPSVASVQAKPGCKTPCKRARGNAAGRRILRLRASAVVSLGGSIIKTALCDQPKTSLLRGGPRRPVVHHPILVRGGVVGGTAYADDVSVRSARARVGDVHDLAMAMPHATVEPDRAATRSIRSVASRSSSSAILARTPLTRRPENAMRM